MQDEEDVEFKTAAPAAVTKKRSRVEQSVNGICVQFSLGKYESSLKNSRVFFKAKRTLVQGDRNKAFQKMDAADSQDTEEDIINIFKKIKI